MDNVLTRYARILEKIYWYAYVQVLWILFTLSGFVIFGIFPATYALLAVMKQQDISTSTIFRAYRQAYKEAFFVSNRAAIVWISVMILLSTNLLILPDTQQAIKLASLSMICFLSLCIVHFFHYFQTSEPAMPQIKRSFSHACLNPKKNVGYLCIFVILGACIWTIPGITCFFGVSTSARAFTFIAQK